MQLPKLRTEFISCSYNTFSIQATRFPMPGRVEPIKGAEAQRVCTLTGVQGKIATQKLVELEDLEKMLLTSIAEAELRRLTRYFGNEPKLPLELSRFSATFSLMLRHRLTERALLARQLISFTTALSSSLTATIVRSMQQK